MPASLTKLSDADLRVLVDALNEGRLVAPFSTLQLNQVIAAKHADDTVAALNQLAESGLNSKQMAVALGLLLTDRTEGRKVEPPIDLVTSGPEAPGITNRDTAVVVRELFAHAQKSVLVVGYSVRQGNSVFAALAKRMEELPELDVQLFLNIARKDKDKTSPNNMVVTRYVHQFRDSQWPQGSPLPVVYYDPRSTEVNKRSSLHAKCVVVDGSEVFVSSANFTKAGQERNIEVGLKIRSPWLAKRLIRHFQLLKEHGIVERAM